MNVTHHFIQAARQYPRQQAIIESKKSVTYADLYTEMLHTAAYFTKKGIGVGDRVLIFVPMSVDLYRVVLALFYIGATAVFLDEWVSKERLVLCCKLADVKGFVGVPKARFYGLFFREIRKIPLKLSLKGRIDKPQKMAEVTDDTSALITFTTGSTGIPKAADRTHGFLEEQFVALQEEIQPKLEDVDMPVLPIVLFLNLGIGCTSVIANFSMTKPEKINPGNIVQQLKDHQVNRITASPYFVKSLAEYCIQKNIQLPSLLKIFTGGAPVFPREAGLYCQAFPQRDIKIVYGSTEVEPISSIGAEELKEVELEKGLPVGEVFSLSNVKILSLSYMNNEDFSFKKQLLKEGEIGEIIVSGPHVLTRYFNNDQAFKESKIVDGDTIWHRTGDSGFIQQGKIYLTGRCKQLLVRNGEIYSPFIVENSLQDINGITMATFVEKEKKIILVFETALSKEEVKPHISKQIKYDNIVCISNIPRDPRHHSKIDYDALKKII